MSTRSETQKDCDNRVYVHVHKAIANHFFLTAKMSHLESRYRWPDDGYGTPTSYQQSATEDSLIATLPSDPSSPLLLSLFKTEHLKFIARNLTQGFPAKYMAYDASQPWLVFWTVQSLSVLGVALDSANKQKYVEVLIQYVDASSFI